jgi:hypothetical protein
MIKTIALRKAGRAVDPVDLQGQLTVSRKSILEKAAPKG